MNYLTILGYAKRRGITLDQKKSARAGKAATKLCKQLGLERKMVDDERFGSVGAYPEVPVLQTVFEEALSW